MPTKLVRLALAALMTAAAAAFAVAAIPDTSRVRLTSGAEAFVAYPAGDGAAPGVIVVPEAGGMSAPIREVARKLSRQGYLAIVPDAGPGEERGVATLTAAGTWLRAQPRSAKSRIGVIGFGAGGALAQQFAASSDLAGAVVVFYGTPLPAARIPSLRASLQGHFGAQDDGIATDRVEAFKAALDRAGKIAEIHVYAGAGPGFMDDGRPSYNPDAERLAWARMLAFLQKQLKR